MKVPVGVFRQEEILAVEAAIRSSEDGPGPDPLDGAIILQSVLGWLQNFVAYPSEDALVAHTLWAAHCYAMDAWCSTPRIAFLSPEPASGKTRALEVTEPLVPNPVQAVNVSPAYLFRKVGDEVRPTILFDEIDTVFGPRAKENEDIRGLLNAGHRKGAVAGRCVVRGRAIMTEELPAYAAVALAGLGNLPDTILSRAVVIRMRRRGPKETVSQYRERDDRPRGFEIGIALAKWISSVSSGLESARPKMPEGVEDRMADVWEPLLAIAEAAGGDWPERARAAAVAFVAESRDDTPSLGVKLLTDLKTVFEGEEMLSTTEILRSLTGMEEAPWADLKGKPLDARRLANLLRPYAVKSGNVRRPGGTLKGYKATDLYDAWSRYLPAASELKNPPQEPQPSSGSENGNSGVADAIPLYATKEVLPPQRNAHFGTDVADVAAISGRQNEANGHSLNKIQDWERCPVCGKDKYIDGPCAYCEQAEAGISKKNLH